MKTYRHLYTAILIAGIGLTALPGQAATPPSPTTISTRLSASFSAWIGSSTNTNSLITGLHSGTSYILIQAPTSPGGTPTQVTFPAPSKPMSYGDIRLLCPLHGRSWLPGHYATDSTRIAERALQHHAHHYQWENGALGRIGNACIRHRLGSYRPESGIQAWRSHESDPGTQRQTHPQHTEHKPYEHPQSGPPA